MSRHGLDALTETIDVLSELKSYLAVVAESENPSAKSDLREAEEWLGNAADKISMLNAKVLANWLSFASSRTISFPSKEVYQISPTASPEFFSREGAINENRKSDRS